MQFSQSEVVIHSNLQILEKKDKECSREWLLKTNPVFMPNVWANKNPKVDTHSQESNSGPHGCEADALPNNYGIHTEDQHFLLNFVLQKRLNEYLLIYRR